MFTSQIIRIAFLHIVLALPCQFQVRSVGFFFSKLDILTLKKQCLSEPPCTAKADRTNYSLAP